MLCTSLNRGITTRAQYLQRGANPTATATNLKGAAVRCLGAKSAYLVGHCLDYAVGNAFCRLGLDFLFGWTHRVTPFVVQRMRVGTLNIQSARGGNLEGCCRGLAALNIDVAVLTETKLHNHLYTRQAFGYEVLASTAASSSQGGVALAVRVDRGSSWDVEDNKTYGPNVIACTWVSGMTRRRLIGVYIPPSEFNGATLNYLSEALEEATVPVIVMGDLNANARETGQAGLRGPLYGEGGPGERRQAEILSVLSSFHLADVGRGFRQKPKVGTWTWGMWRGDTRIRSTLDYVLSDGSTRFTRHRVRTVPYARTDHRAVYADFTLESMKKHRRVVKRDSTFPIPPPGVNSTAADQQFAEPVAGIPRDDRTRDERARKREERRARPHWISAETWQMIRRKGEMWSKRPTQEDGKLDA